MNTRGWRRLAEERNIWRQTDGEERESKMRAVAQLKNKVKMKNKIKKKNKNKTSFWFSGFSVFLQNQLLSL